MTFIRRRSIDIGLHTIRWMVCDLQSQYDTVVAIYHRQKQIAVKTNAVRKDGSPGQVVEILRSFVAPYIADILAAEDGYAREDRQFAEYLFDACRKVGVRYMGPITWAPAKAAKQKQKARPQRRRKRATAKTEAQSSCQTPVLRRVDGTQPEAR